MSQTHQRTRDVSQDFEGSHYRLGNGCQFLGVGLCQMLEMINV